MPKLDETSGCLAADRNNIRQRIERISSIKSETRKDLYKGILKTVRHIDGHLEDELNLETLAKISAISKYYLIKVFSEVFECTPHQYVKQRRVFKARHLLKHTDKSIIDICFEVGFKSQGSFTTLFTKMNAMSPKKYRDKFKK